MVTAMYEPKFNREKYQKLVQYIVQRFASKDNTGGEVDPYFGAVKLNKLLFFCDFTAYSRWFEPITGATYIHLREGPVVDNWKGERALMTNRGVVAMDTVEFFDYRQHRLRPTASTPSAETLMEDFSPRERALIDEVCHALRHMSAREVTELSHKHLGWRMTDHLEPIPYESALFRDPAQDGSECIDELNAVNHA